MSARDVRGRTTEDAGGATPGTGDDVTAEGTANAAGDVTGDITGDAAADMTDDMTDDMTGGTAGGPGAPDPEDLAQDHGAAAAMPASPAALEDPTVADVSVADDAPAADPAADAVADDPADGPAADPVAGPVDGPQGAGLPGPAPEAFDALPAPAYEGTEGTALDDGTDTVSGTDTGTTGTAAVFAPPVEAPPPPPPVDLSGPPSQRLRQLGVDLPAVAPPAGAYVPAVRTGDLVFTSGQLPMVDGTLALTGVVGDQPVDLSVDQARALARTCALNAVAAIAGVVDVDRVRRVVKVVGFVASAPGFTQQPRVVDGASELLGQLWDEDGRHARSAVGVSALPLGAPVEVEVVVEVEPGA